MPSPLRCTLSSLRVLLATTLVACAARPAAPPPAPAPPPPPVEAAPRPTPPSPTLRLPTAVRPTGYAAELTLDPAQPTFQGVLDIELEVKEPADAVWLQGHGLSVKEASLTVGGAPVAVSQLKGTGDFLGFLPATALRPGPAHLRLVYEGALNERELSGAFRTKEADDWYVFTQFEAIGARRVFPCFDEPGFKVPWQLTLHVPAGNVAVSNTPLEGPAPDTTRGTTTWHFARTKPLPSYLIAFGVGPFDFLEARPSGQRGVPTRIITPKGRAQEGTYAAQVTPEILGALERYFDVPYGYDKVDVLAVPLLGGAMEHPGLVTFSEQIILARPSEDNVERQRDFYETQMHELAHQWFGDLVTLAWWDDLWLNESFASWATPRLVETTQPSWDAPIERVRGRSFALMADSLVSARRIRQPIESESDIHNAFDGITYGKGSAVLAMTESWLGREVFQRGARRYLLAHAHRNATGKDFIDALSAEAHQDVAGVMSSFLDRGGAPLVSARLDCTGKQPVLKLAQSRFLPLGSVADTKQTWKLPLCVRYGAGRASARTCTLMEAETAELPLPDVKACPTWWIPNAEGAGYYRSSVDAQVLGKLLSTESAHLSRAERVVLLGDVNALVSAGVMPAADALGLLPGLAGEKDRLVFESALDLLGLVNPAALSEARRADRERLVRDLYGARARALGFTPRAKEDADAQLLRPRLLGLVAQGGGEPKLLAEARTLTERWLTDAHAITQDMVDTVLGAAASRGDAALHAKMLAAVRAEKDRKRREQLYWGLGQFRDVGLARQSLGLLLDPTVDPREAVGLLLGASFSVHVHDAAFAFVKEHYDALAARLPEDRVGLLTVSVSLACDPVSRQEAAAFFTPRMEHVPGGPRTLAQRLERMDQCIAFKAAQGPSVESFLAAPRPVKTSAAP